ncbi:innexin inx2-like [Oratosquilla oratoria]|uniref:innexin inx2-like n=1 Tax=Oratosquilla oratoria TaxID=337810 RepID=UPI003F75879C
MVVGVVASIAGLIKVKYGQSTIVDGAVFKLHYRWTTALCFLGCALISASDYIGSPIQCLKDGAESMKAVVTYCWVSSTFTLDDRMLNTTAEDRSHWPHQGVGMYQEDKYEHHYHAYYQWVPFVLFAMGCFFYLPHLIWKSIENKRLDQLLQGLNILSLDECCEKKKENIVKYMMASWGQNGIYAFHYFACEILNLVNVVAQMILLDKFFGGFFANYGTEVLNHLGEEDPKLNPLLTVFPRVTKCTFHRYGSSGTVMREDNMCILPQNILNEKLFLLIWFWLVILITITAAQLVSRICLFASPFLRLRMLEHRGKMSASSEIEHSIQQMQLGDFFLVELIGVNVDAICFRDILQELCKPRERASSAYPKNSGTYRPFYSDDDLDPHRLKRELEMEDAVV